MFRYSGHLRHVRKHYDFLRAMYCSQHTIRYIRYSYSVVYLEIKFVMAQLAKMCHGHKTRSFESGHQQIMKRSYSCPIIWSGIEALLPTTSTISVHTTSLTPGVAFSRSIIRSIAALSSRIVSTRRSIVR